MTDPNKDLAASIRELQTAIRHQADRQASITADGLAALVAAAEEVGLTRDWHLLLGNDDPNTVD